MKHRAETMIKTRFVLLLFAMANCVASDPPEIRQFNRAVSLELTSETSANASIGDKSLAAGAIAIGDLNRDGMLDIVIGYA